MDAFKPLDVYPCTTDEETWHQGVSMEALFGHTCSAKVFVHDQEMMALEDRRAASRARKRSAEETESIADRATASQRTEGSQGFDGLDATLVDTDSDAVHRQILNGLQEGINQSSKRQRTCPSSSVDLTKNNSLGHPCCSGNILHERRVDAIKDFFRSDEAQLEVIEISDESSQMSYNKISGDVVLENSLDQESCEEAAAVAQENGYSNILAPAIDGVPGRHLPRILYTERAADEKTEEGEKYAEAEVSKSKGFRLEIKRLRKLMPTADDAMCYNALMLKGGHYIKARDLLAKWVGKDFVDNDYLYLSDDEGGDRGKAQQQSGQDVWDDDEEGPDTPLVDGGEAGSVEFDAEHLETQISLADSEFDSQEHSVPNAAYGQGEASLEKDKIRNRKEAYKAAQGLHYRWHEFSPMSSGNAHTEEEMEL